MVDFLILGTAKAGTTSLNSLLATHREICLSKPKETWFFDGRDYDLGIEHYLARYFPHYTPGMLRGEVATSLLYVPYMPQRIARDLPDTRLIAILRDPVERAFSDWWMMHTRGWDPLSFDAAIDDNLRRLENGPDFSNPKEWANHLDAIRKQGKVCYRTYVDYGFYGSQLERFHDAGLGDRLLILQFEQMKRDGVSYLGQVFDFLGLAPPASEALGEAFGKRQNEALPSRRVGQMIAMLNSLGVARIIPESAKQATKQWISKHRPSPKISSEIKSRLEQIYRPQASDLAIYSDLDLSLWPSMKVHDLPRPGS